MRQDTMEFIQVLVAFKILPAYRLGWDPTMKLYQLPLDGRPCEPIPSYRIVPSCADFASNAYQANWVISMPTKDDPSQREEFVTIRKPIKALTGEVDSRGAIVWEVVKRKDIGKAGPQVGEQPLSLFVAYLNNFFQIFILKQCWQPFDPDVLYRKYRQWKNQDQKPLEAEIYDQAGIGDRICSAEMLGDTASTLKLRDGLGVRPLQNAIWERAVKLKESKVSLGEPMVEPESGDITQCHHNNKPHLLLSDARTFKYDIFYTQSDRYENRAQTRLLMVNLGFSLTYFLDLLELLQAVRGAVKGVL